jgi:hypothetical protein
MPQMTLGEIVTELEGIAVQQQILRRCAMIYQYQAKMTVAAHYGLTLDEVNLPFDQWMALRRKYQQETGKPL